jgi:hypothetical protein
MSRGADADVIATIFDLLAERRIEAETARSLMTELARNPATGDEVLKLLEPERIERSRTNHPAGANIQQITVSSV